MRLSMRLLVSSWFCLWWWLGFHGFDYELGFFFMLLSMLLAWSSSLDCDVVLDLSCFCGFVYDVSLAFHCFVHGLALFPLFFYCPLCFLMNCLSLFVFLLFSLLFGCCPLGLSSVLSMILALLLV